MGFKTIMFLTLFLAIVLISLKIEARELAETSDTIYKETHKTNDHAIGNDAKNLAWFPHWGWFPGWGHGWFPGWGHPLDEHKNAFGVNNYGTSEPSVNDAKFLGWYPGWWHWWFPGFGHGLFHGKGFGGYPGHVNFDGGYSGYHGKGDYDEEYPGPSSSEGGYSGHGGYSGKGGSGGGIS